MFVPEAAAPDRGTVIAAALGTREDLLLLLLLATLGQAILVSSPRERDRRTLIEYVIFGRRFAASAATAAPAVAERYRP
jgi:hypothetical protein